jgi:hypothetical protein
MTRIWAAIMVTAMGLSATPALAQDPAPTLSGPGAADMPFTDQFASAVTRYRNCVLKSMDGQALTDATTMTRGAMKDCAAYRSEVQQQLAADIAAQNAGHAQHVALVQAEDGVASIDPMIEQAAIERAHMAFARVMF